MNCLLPASLISLPNEVVDEILLLLVKPTLLSVRLVNRRLGTHATRLLFRSVRLGARQRIGQDSGLFCFAARSEDAALTRDPSHLGPLRDLVREVTLDTWLGSSFEYFTCDDWEPNLPVHPGDFMNALPNLRRFSNLSAVHLRFNEVCGDDRGSGYVEEGLDFRYRVLDTTFRCLAGTWNVSDQQDIDREINLKYSTDYAMSQVVPEPPSTGPLPIKTLTVSNLADIPDERLTSSKAFQTVLSLPSLVDLKLYFTIRGDNYWCNHGWGDHEWVRDYPIWVSEKYKFFDSLPQTWLRPSIATNLRTLSLYSASPWGWNPKMEFRFVNPTENGFPNLKVLALGNYVFSHAWQIDWFASQGSKTVAGGLEELYLDKCRVMFHATHLTPLDQSTAIVGKDPEEKDIKVSNTGY
ncbi:hypothetical protein NM208_g9037 [Fusarium decemcellulare]|uniref:Uncharacterized protein n=1 Tax=Fusarium decemcellulare TaxID=57161 RepID=A0ACC1S340_9HYPO|nr:hypothetical protein NM208_g9037 [Fusarium decemcellulare]